MGREKCWYGLVLWGTHVVASAGGLGGTIVFDPGNFAKNAITATESARHTVEQIKANITHLQQLEQLIAARRPLSPQDLKLAGGATSVAEIEKRVSENFVLMKTVDALADELDGTRERFNVRFTTAQGQGMTLHAYYDALKTRAAQGERQARVEVDTDRKRLERINSTYSQVTTWGSTINGIDSQVAGLSLLGAQMNVMVAQNAELLAFMVQEGNVRRRDKVDAEQRTVQSAADDVQTEEQSVQIYRQSRDALLSTLKSRKSKPRAATLSDPR